MRILITLFFLWILCWTQVKAQTPNDANSYAELTGPVASVVLGGDIALGA